MSSKFIFGSRTTYSAMATQRIIIFLYYRGACSGLGHYGFRVHTTASLLILWLAILQADYATKHKNRGKGKVLIKRYDGLFPHFCN